MKKQTSKITKLSLITIFLFLQIVFPKTVLSKELEKYQISINDSILETSDYNLSDDLDKNINITQNYIGENNYIFTPSKNLKLDFINRLYGKYTYNLSVSDENKLIDKKTININYLGDNNKIINTNNIYYHNKEYFILKDSDKDLTVSDVISKFNNNLETYGASIEIVEIKDEEDNKLLPDEIVKNNHKLKLTATYEDYQIENTIKDYYNLIIVEDLNEDGKINNKDIQFLIIDRILKEETNNNFNVIDATNILLETLPTDPLDNLITTFKYNKNIYLDEEITLSYYIEGFDKDILKGIEGNLYYDKTILQLTGIEINNILGGYNDSGHFIYLLDDYNKDGLLITFKFKPIKTGATNIKIENIIASTTTSNKALLDNDLFEGTINVLEYGKGGDVANDNQKEEVILPKETQIEDNTKANQTHSYIRPVVLSTDNSIKNLTIKNYGIEFDKNVLEYKLKVKNNVNSLELDIILNDSRSSYVILGNEKFKTGENVVEIIVTAENGDKKTYTIKVNKEAKEIIKEQKEEKSITSKSIVIILIVLVIIGLIYIIFKDDEEEKK